MTKKVAAPAPATKQKVAGAKSAPTHESFARARPALQKRSASPLARLRKAVAPALPEATEKEAWGEPIFRVRDKIFAMFATDHHHDGNIAVWCKAAMGMQEILDRRRPRALLPPTLRRPEGLDRHPARRQGRLGGGALAARRVVAHDRTAQARRDAPPLPVTIERDLPHGTRMTLPTVC